MTPADTVRSSRHYEAALEGFLKDHQTPYVALDETRRVIFAGARLKSFDFLIYPSSGAKLIVDVKGRKFPYTSGSTRRYWENWISRADLDGLTQWQSAFGEGYRAALVFAYWLSGPPERWPAGPVHTHDEQLYVFLYSDIAEYARHARQRSGKWDTVSVPGKAFRQMVHPLADLL
ncbi:MAG: HYExAFE family protein [Phycisphaerales bacterium]|nr:MAG: HYExAFE family protein [Phycisphaerales bacterium]